MCYAVYIGTDSPLQTSEWNKDDRRFHVKGLTEKDLPIRANFSKPYIYYAGSNLGCGCGFFTSSLLDSSDPEEMQRHEEAQASLKALTALIQDSLSTSESVELFVTWEGRQAEPPSKRRAMSPDELVSTTTPYGDDDQMLVVNSPVEEQDFIVLKII
jgi:hypothetical protein